MNTLWARLAALLVVAIVLVVALASVVAVTVIGFPGPQRFVEDLARGVALIATEAEKQSDPRNAGHGGAHWFSLSPEPLPDTDPAQTAMLRGALKRIGKPLAVNVTQNAGSPTQAISVPVAGRGWITISYFKPPEPAQGGWAALASWMLVIIMGTVSVALFIAYRMTQPLRLVENSIAAVGPDGVLPHVPETGSAEVRATAQALNRLSARLKSTIESRMRLVAAAGHDLRTPMTRMRLRAEFIEGEAERAAWLKDLDELEHIADSAIGLVREEVASSPLEPVRLDALTREITDELQALGLPVKVSRIDPAVVSASPWALKRALRNLIMNAATHGGGAMVELACVGARATLSIVDEGPGIPNELLDRVFEPFFRVDPGRRKSFSGAGLGLAIAKEIIDRQGDTIIIENRRRRGLLQKIVFSAVERTTAL